MISFRFFVSRKAYYGTYWYVVAVPLVIVAAMIPATIESFAYQIGKPFDLMLMLSSLRLMLIVLFILLLIPFFLSFFMSGFLEARIEGDRTIKIAEKKRRSKEICFLPFKCKRTRNGFYVLSGKGLSRRVLLPESDTDGLPISNYLMKLGFDFGCDEKTEAFQKDVRSSFNVFVPKAVCAQNECPYMLMAILIVLLGVRVLFLGVWLIKEGMADWSMALVLFVSSSLIITSGIVFTIYRLVSFPKGNLKIVINNEARFSISFGDMTKCIYVFNAPTIKKTSYGFLLSKSFQTGVRIVLPKIDKEGKSVEDHLSNAGINIA